jgi:hypothetical protein
VTYDHDYPCDHILCCTQEQSIPNTYPPSFGYPNFEHILPFICKKFILPRALAITNPYWSYKSPIVIALIHVSLIVIYGDRQTGFICLLSQNPSATELSNSCWLTNHHMHEIGMVSPSHYVITANTSCPEPPWSSL